MSTISTEASGGISGGGSPWLTGQYVAVSPRASQTDQAPPNPSGQLPWYSTNVGVGVEFSRVPVADDGSDRSLAPTRHPFRHRVRLGARPAHARSIRLGADRRRPCGRP